MIEEIDELSFYFQDFSTESAWETFNAQLVDVFEKWDLPNGEWGRTLREGELFKCEWQVQKEAIKYQEKDFTVSYYAAVLKPTEVADSAAVTINESQVHLDLMSMKNTFQPPPVFENFNSELHILADAYGLRRFVILHTTEPTEYLENPTEFKLFLSAINMVAAEVSSTVPIFLQILSEDNHYLGVYVSPRLRINFDLISLSSVPSTCKNLSGLLRLFKEKHCETYLHPVIASVCTTYKMKRMDVIFPTFIPFQKLNKDAENAVEATENLDFNDIFSSFESTVLCDLPYGAFCSTSDYIYFVCTWPEIAENTIKDTDVDFVPSEAHCGTIHFAVNCEFYLTSCLDDFLKLSKLDQKIDDFFVDYFVDFISFVGQHFSDDIVKQFDKLSHPSPPKKLAGPISEYELNQMMCYLFPDIHQNIKIYENKLDKTSYTTKSGFRGSLISRLSCLLATCNSHFGGGKGVAQLWATFTRKLRFLVNYCIEVPDVAPGYPDPKTCLLHQKLQMLNICIARRALCRAIHKKINNHNAIDKNAAERRLYGFESTRYNDMEILAGYIKLLKPDKIWHQSADISSFQPEGRQQRWCNQKLLQTNEPLYVPKLQDITNKSERQLLNDASMMFPLESDSIQIICYSLLCYMEAFKAANPKAEFNDFRRWYNFRGLEEQNIDDEIVLDDLSVHMLTIWQTIWRDARPVPAELQKTNFDAHNVALEVLYFLESLKIGEIYELTLGSLLNAAVRKLKEIFASANVLDIFESKLDKIFKDINHPDLDPRKILKKICILEQHFYHYNCAENFVRHSKKINQDSLRESFRQMLKNGDDLTIYGPINFNHQIIKKNYVLRIDGETTSKSKDEVGPQFLRAVIFGECEALQLCGAFAGSTTFI